MELPSALQNAFRRGYGAVFVGSGASVDAGLPTWQQLSIALASGLAQSAIQDRAASPRSVSAIPQYYENEHGRDALVARLQDLIPKTNKGPSRIHTLLAQLPCTQYYTTSYDVVLQTALFEHRRWCDVIADEETARGNPRRDRTQLRKLHGSIDRPQSLVITRADFARYERLHPVLCDQLKVDLAAQSFLFVGYNLTDPDFNAVYDNIISRYSPFNRRHFITVVDPDYHERAELESRGLNPIDLTEWGASLNDALPHFLSHLCESTSRSLHVKRFFRGLDPEATTPIVIPSEFDEREMAATYHAMDLHVAMAIDRALASLGQSSAIYADKSLLSDAESLLADNLILVGSTSGNALTRLVFERAQQGPGGENNPITPRFESSGDGRVLTDDVLDFSYKSPNPALRLEKPRRRAAKEYALITRCPNPWAPDKWIFVFAGLWGLGTHAVGEFLHDFDNYQLLPSTGDRTVAVLEVSYKSFDPHKPDYVPRLIIHAE